MIIPGSRVLLIVFISFACGLHASAVETPNEQYVDLEQAEYVSMIDASFSYFTQNSPWNNYKSFHLSISGVGAREDDIVKILIQKYGKLTVDTVDEGKVPGIWLGFKVYASDIAILDISDGLPLAGSSHEYFLRKIDDKWKLMSAINSGLR